MSSVFRLDGVIEEIVMCLAVLPYRVIVGLVYQSNDRYVSTFVKFAPCA